MTESASAVQVYASANRLLFARTTSTGETGWSAPQVYNQYNAVPYNYLYGIQVNTYPSSVPSGQYVSISGKANLSMRTPYDSRMPSGQVWYPITLNLDKLTVVCGWDGQPMVTDSSSLQNYVTNWSGNINSTQNWVTSIDFTFNWTGHFSSSARPSSGSLMSCAIRPRDNVYNVSTTISGNRYISDGVYTTQYAYSANNSFESYLSVEVTDNSQSNAIQQTTDAVNNVNNTLQQTNNALNNVNNSLQEQNNRDQQDRDNLENQAQQTESDADSAQQDVESGTASIMSNITSIVGAFNTGPTDCVVSIQAGANGSLALNNMNLCSAPESVKNMIHNISSIVVTVSVLWVSYSVLRQFLDIYEAFLANGGIKH